METLMQAVERLSRAGYDDEFVAIPEGLRAVRSGGIHDPGCLKVDEVVRFEGPSDPADESILFALRCEVHGVKGTYATPFGPAVDALDAEAVRRLSLHEARSRTRAG